ncbi:hypothetical protein BDW02DRAFT_574467 [Decorospora gaudefroyi]|uniref:Uncharacterized protein n=1 Tax=Decorospora gaudefroyi TaxID=184978 RepID=A0A6A5K2V5_9PLEO|nr:hypothetical protein BDW02DRAFT_574467 [Decorospora gaudefroyi]
MVDGFTVAGLAGQSVSLTLDCLKIVKRYAETVKHAREETEKVILNVQRLKRSFDFLRRTLLELRHTNLDGLQHELRLDHFKSNMEELLTFMETLFDKPSSMSFWTKLSYPLKKRKIDGILRILQVSQDQAIDVIQLVNIRFSIRNAKAVESLTDSLQKYTPLEVAFNDMQIVAEGDQMSEKSKQPKIIRTWLGQVDMESRSDAYNALRHRLADCAYCGDWEGLWNVLNDAAEKFGENWVNAVRPRKLYDVEEMSFYTPLHQMVFNHASAAAVKKLLDMGASNLLRERGRDITERANNLPLEMAYDREMTYLYDLLTPKIRSPLSIPVLRALESRFHQLIREDLRDFVYNSKLALPELVVCTELRDEYISFPIYIDGAKKGYKFQLDRRELLVMRVNIPNDRDQSYLRISEDQVLSIAEPLVFASNAEPDEDDSGLSVEMDGV